MTVAVDAAGTICGFVSWNRGWVGEGRQHQGCRSTGNRCRRLSGAFGDRQFREHHCLVKIDTSGDDLARLFLPSIQWKVIESYPYMLTILDVPKALNRRRYPSGMTATLRFAVEEISWWRTTVDISSLWQTAGPTAHLLIMATGRSPAGLKALLYAGTQSCANLRMAGHLNGGDLNGRSRLGCPLWRPPATHLATTSELRHLFRRHWCEAEFDDITVGHEVILALQPHLASSRAFCIDPADTRSSNETLSP